MAFSVSASMVFVGYMTATIHNGARWVFLMDLTTHLLRHSSGEELDLMQI